MDQHDEVRERSAAFYADAQGHPAEGAREANSQHNLTLREVLPTFIEKDDFALLDIGCGRGRIARIVRDLFPQSKVFGIDVSAEQVEHARSFVSDGVFTVGNEISLPFDDGFFDHATCRMSIHHYPDMMSHLREVRRVLRPGGCYIIIDPIPSSGLQDHWLNEAFLAAEREAPGDGHIKFYTIEEYERFSAATGFTVDRQVPLPHTIVWSRSSEYKMSVYKHILSAPDDFRSSVRLEDEGDQYRYDLPTHVLSLLKQ